MILIGRYRSPFTRRVAISLRLLGLAYEHRPYTAWSNLDAVRAVNPVGRVPALVLDSGETLFDSTAIVDYLDHLAGQERALTPVSEPQRRRVMRIVCCALGTLEKVVAALYECTMRPPEKIHAPWIEHNESQARGGLRWLDALALSPWLAGEALTQADVTTVVMHDFTRIVNPSLLPPGSYPTLGALSQRCNELDAFRATQPVNAVDAANPALPS